MNELLSFQDIFDVDFQQGLELVDDESFLQDENQRLNLYFQESILNYDLNRENLPSTLSEKEIAFIKNHSVISAVDAVYHLLSKFTVQNDEQQISTFVDCLKYLAEKKIPKEYIGGFVILMVKYHHLP